MIYPILTKENPLLRKKAVLVKNPLDPEIQKLIPDLIKTMVEKDGIGLAAPQIGKSIKLIVVNIKNQPLALINPKILSKSFKKEVDEEGCLSVPGVFGLVKRHKKVIVVALDKNGVKITIKGEGLLARVLQHEIDHLNGVLFIDKVIEITKDKSTEEKIL